MKMILKYKWLMFKLMLIALLIVYSIFLLNLSYPDFRENSQLNNLEDEKIIIELKVGEDYDIEDYINTARSKISKELLKKIDGHFNLFNTSNVEIKGTRLKATKAGIAWIHYNYKYVSYNYSYAGYSGSGSGSKGLLNIRIIITDDNENNYIPVHNIKDLKSDYGTYVLMNDIVINERYGTNYILEGFRGVFINPNNYNITIDSNIMFLFYGNNGVIDGLDIRYNSYGDYNSWTGLFVTMWNGGIIRNSTFDYNLTGNKISLGMVGFENCTITGTFTIIEDEESSFILRNEGSNNNFNITIQGDTSNVSIPDFDDNDSNIYNIVIIDDNT